VVIKSPADEVAAMVAAFEQSEPARQAAAVRGAAEFAAALSGDDHGASSAGGLEIEAKHTPPMRLQVRPRRWSSRRTYTSLRTVFHTGTD
jgi:hypothetical protein